MSSHDPTSAAARDHYLVTCANCRTRYDGTGTRCPICNSRAVFQ